MLLALFALAGCTNLVTIEVDAESTTTIEQGSILENFIGAMGFGDFTNMDITASDELRNQGVEPGDINEVFLTAFDLSITGPESGDFAFLESLDVYVEAPGLESQLIASTSAFGEGVRQVAVDLEGVDLTDYVVSENMTLTTDVTGHRPEVTTDVKAYVALDVGVTAQGIRNQAR
ncbi:MAG: hypothetical protein H6741_23615 [Alphaproteobacteria bacterium]|nr:hypothetical protein [Alphaproteobacteria bacterium]MCB9795696.1 hypothetical protein [Alphaproteobacteria bacterium]